MFTVEYKRSNHHEDDWVKVIFNDNDILLIKTMMLKLKIIEKNTSTFINSLIATGLHIG